MPGGAEFSTSARADPARGWLVIELESGGVARFVAALAMFPTSRVSQDLIDFLTPIGLVEQGPAGTLILRQLTLDGEALPNITVRVDEAIDRLRVHAVLGLDFLLSFDEVRLYPIYSRLTFVDP